VMFTPVWFAVTQSDVQSQAELETLTAGLAALGRHLGYGLSMVHEHDTRCAGPILRYDPVTGVVSQP
jgi:hypothetical protein